MPRLPKTKTDFGHGSVCWWPHNIRNVEVLVLVVISGLLLVAEFKGKSASRYLQTTTTSLRADPQSKKILSFFQNEVTNSYNNQSRTASTIQQKEDVSFNNTVEAVSNTVVPYTCSSLQNRLSRKALATENAITLLTRCPESNKWLNSYFNNASLTQEFLALHVGCNKGYDALYTAAFLSRQVEVFNKAKWRQALKINGPGACRQAVVEKPVNGTLPKRPVEVHCIEAMPQTAERLQVAAQVTTAADHGLLVHNIAMTGIAGQNSILFPNPNASIHVGSEVFNMDHCKDPRWRPQCKEVQAMTLDEYVAKNVDREAPSNRRIPFLSIDVEGFDFTVMKAANKTLARTDYLEFEYHGQGDWGKQSLKDAIDMLKDAGFVCYWAGVNKLWRITDCWMDYFDVHIWSNVACVSPSHQPELAEQMEQVFEDTLVD